MAVCGTPWLPTLILLLFWVVMVASADSVSESDALLKLIESFQDNKGLASWNKASGPPCSDNKENWVGVLCSRGKVWGLKLENMGLKGTIDVDALKGLPDLRTFSFMGNNLDGTLPDFSQLPLLKTIYLSNNKFSGEIPAETFKGMESLKKLHIANNQLSGSIPSSLTILPKIVELKLDNNKFQGPVPEFIHTTLQTFDVANNQLTGEIPTSLSKMPAAYFSGNPGLCGAPLDQSCQSSATTDSAVATGAKKKKDHSVLSIVVVAVIVVVALFVIGLVIFIVSRRNHKEQSVEDPRPTPLSNITQKKAKKAGKGAAGAKREADGEGSGHGSSHHSTGSRRGESTKLTFLMDDRERFDLQDLLKANAEILGSGCFSSSYKAALLTGPVMVVKRFKQMNNVGKEEFQEHMRRLGRLKHHNLLPIVAYYYRKEEKLLVTDFVNKGSLAVRLHGHQSLGQPSLDWPTRLRIVKGIAKSLQYLYNELPSLIAPHGHLKSSNVLLNDSFEPFLADYGLVPVMNQEHAHELMAVYKSPEYLENGRITKKTDVWSFGILMVEILTGKLPASFLQQGNISSNNNKGQSKQGKSNSSSGSVSSSNGKIGEQGLEEWLRSVVPEEWTSEVFDKEMGATKNAEGEMIKLMKIALACCQGDVDKRWDLKEVVEKIEEVKERDGDDDFYSSYASEADYKSSRGLSDDLSFS